MNIYTEARTKRSAMRLVLSCFFLIIFCFFFVKEISTCYSCGLPETRANRMNLLLRDCYSFRNCLYKILSLVARFSGVAGADNNFVFSAFKFLRKGK